MPTLKEQTDAFFQRAEGGAIIVAADPYGVHQPLFQFGMEMVAVDEYRHFVEFVNKAAEEALNKTFVADASILIYQFHDMREVPKLPPMGWNEYGIKTLIPWCEANGHRPTLSVKLRDAAFLRSEDKDVRLALAPHYDILKAKGYKEFIDNQNHRERLYKGDEYFGTPLTIVKPAEGFLIFSGDKVGQRALKDYYQHVADNFFHPRMTSEGMFIYSQQYTTPDLLPYINKTAGLSENGLAVINSYSEDKYIPSHRMNSMKHDFKQQVHLSTNPLHSDYIAFMHYTKAKPNQQNIDIAQLLSIYKRGVYELGEKNFSYAGEFSEMGVKHPEKNKDTGELEFNPDNYRQVTKEARDKAIKILQADFDVRSHRSLEKLLGDPEIDVPFKNVILEAPHRRVLHRGDTLYMPDLDTGISTAKYITAEFDKDRVALTTDSPAKKRDSVYEIRDGKEHKVPYTKESKSKVSHAAGKPKTPKPKR